MHTEKTIIHYNYEHLVQTQDWKSALDVIYDIWQILGGLCYPFLAHIEKHIENGFTTDQCEKIKKKKPTKTIYLE